MKPTDSLGFAIAGALGLWWVVIPKTVIRFYKSFLGDQLQVPKAIVIRFIGFAWLLLILVIGLTLRSTGTQP